MYRFILPLVTLPLLTLSVTAAADVLPLKPQVQQREFWCWAASTASVLDFNGHPTEQCEIAEKARQRTKLDMGDRPCCSGPVACDQVNYVAESPGSVEDLLSSEGLEPKYYERALTRAELAKEIEQRRPTMVVWDWSHEGGAHMVVVHGVDGKTVYVMDPARQKAGDPNLKVMTFERVGHSQQHDWTRTLASDSPHGEPHEANAPSDPCPGGNCRRSDEIVCRAPNTCHFSAGYDSEQRGCVFVPKADGTPCRQGPLTNGACAHGECIERSPASVAVVHDSTPVQPETPTDLNSSANPANEARAEPTQDSADSAPTSILGWLLEAPGWLMSGFLLLVIFMIVVLALIHGLRSRGQAKNAI